MERGFKSRCEEIARSVRAELDIPPPAPLSADTLAGHMGVLVWSVTQLGISGDDIEQLTVVDGEAWSAITVEAARREAIIINPSHKSGRYSSDVMHELAHLMLAHEPSTMYFVGDGELALRGFKKDIEDEANWLAGVLLLPREALVSIRRRRLPDVKASEMYGVSGQMLNFRMNVSGVNRQFSPRRKTRVKTR